MLTLPDLLPFLDGTDDALAIGLDWLQDPDAHAVPLPAEKVLPGLLLAYRGEPPEYLGETWEQDEALRKLVGAWLKNVEPHPLVLADGKHRAWDGKFKMARPRWEAVLACEVESEVDLTLRAMGLLDRQIATAEQERILARARREQKRRVLSLFGDVTTELRLVISWEKLAARRGRPEAVIENRMRAAGFRRDRPITRTEDQENRRAIWTQTLPAPEWIPSEPGSIPADRFVRLDTPG